MRHFLLKKLQTLIDHVPNLLGPSCVLQENHWRTLKSLQACVEGDQIKDGMWLLQSTCVVPSTTIGAELNLGEKERWKWMLWL